MMFRCGWNHADNRCIRYPCPGEQPCAGWDPMAERQIVAGKWDAFSRGRVPPDPFVNDVAAAKAAAEDVTAKVYPIADVARETSQPEDLNVARIQTIADVRARNDERAPNPEPRIIVRASDPYAIELAELYTSVLLKQPMAAAKAFGNLLVAAMDGDEERTRTQGGMVHQLADEMRAWKAKP